MALHHLKVNYVYNIFQNSSLQENVFAKVPVPLNRKQSYNCLIISLLIRPFIVRQMGHCMGGNFNIHIWAWSASPSVQVER